MGPIALFDKSFLESLNVDEAVLFDHFFYPVICPLFYVETLADLAKPQNRGRRPDDVVGSIAYKAPQMHGGPNTFHLTLAASNLMGQHVAMTGQIVVSHGNPVVVDGERAVVFKSSPEREAFDRWQRGEFEKVERFHAERWREQMRTLDLMVLADQASNYGLDLRCCKSLSDAKELAEQVIQQLPSEGQMRFALDKFALSAEEREIAMTAWGRRGEQRIQQFAPYANYVLRLQVFFEIALATGKISADRPSNLNDLGYLFYLPFCMMFVSSDRLHRACAALFLRPDQEFVWGQDLKADLRANHDALMQLPEADRLRGLIALCPRPHAGSLVAQLHERFLNTRHHGIFAEGIISGDDELLRKFERLTEAAETASGANVPFAPEDADSITIERMVQKRRGSWFQLPHDLKPARD